MASDTQAEAKEAIFRAVVQLCESADNYGGATAGAMVRDAAYAWRAAVGGNQPGGTVVEVKN